ncbi:MAG: stalk domain-containing protein [Chloroflexota bacterium]
MKRRLILALSVTLAILVSFSAGALAGSRWGDYEGHPVVRLLVNGTEASGDVPAINLAGRTMVPARLVAEALGAQVDWDPESYTAIISDPGLAALQWPDQVNKYLDTLAQDFTGWDWAVKQGLLQPVNAEVTVNGCTWHIYAVLADATQTNVVFGVSGEGATFPRVTGLNCCTFNGQRLLTRGGGGKIIDGMSVGIMTLDPIPAQVGTVTMTAEAMMTSTGAIDGSWTVSFPVSRTKCDTDTREYRVDKQLPLGGGTVTVSRLTVTPIHTVLTVEWSGGPGVADQHHYPRLQLVTPPGFADAGWGTRLLGPDGAELARGIGGGRSNGRTSDDGQTTVQYTMFFDRCDPQSGSVTLRVGAAVYVLDETRVPLEPGTEVRAPDGRPIKVIALEGTAESGKVTFSYEPDASFPPFYNDWMVLDSTGELTAMQFSPDADGLKLAWQLPAGREAVAMVLSGCWMTDVAGDLTIDME